MDEVFQLPGGLSTSRRSALKAVALAGGLGSVYVVLTRAKVGAVLLGKPSRPQLTFHWHAMPIPACTAWACGACIAGDVRARQNPQGVLVCRQRDPGVRRALRKYRVGSLIQLGILGYVALALPYWIKVACPRSSAPTLPPCLTRPVAGLCLRSSYWTPHRLTHPPMMPSADLKIACILRQQPESKEQGVHSKNVPDPWGMAMLPPSPRMAMSACAQALSFASPKALLKALLPQPTPAASPGTAQQAERVAAFRRFIQGVERRGGGEKVPEFPAGAQWFNSPPLRLARCVLSLIEPSILPCPIGQQSVLIALPIYAARL